MPRRRQDRLDPERFATLVTEAIDRIPEQFARYLENVTVLIEDDPTPEQLDSVGLDPRRDTLFGLYEGIALPERPHDFHGHPPDRITIFRRPILDACRSEREVRREIEVTVVHEIAHFFGIDERRVRQLGY